MSARTFGNGDAEARVAARYAGIDGHAIAAAQPTGLEGVTREPLQSRITYTPASAKAVKFLVDLWMERSNKATREQVQAWAEMQDRQIVSDKIEWLKAQPKLAVTGYGEIAAQVPNGRYAVTGDAGQTVFVRVDKPTEGKWAGRTFVAIQASDELHKTYGGQALGLLSKIVEAGPKDAGIRYGRELGVCGRCGRTLTDEASRAAGIGPVCASK